MFQQNTQFPRTFDGRNGLFAKRHHGRSEIYGRLTAIGVVDRATGHQIGGGGGGTWRRRLLTTTCWCHTWVTWVNRRIDTERRQLNQFKPSIQHLTYSGWERRAKKSELLFCWRMATDKPLLLTECTTLKLLMKHLIVSFLFLVILPTTKINLVQFGRSVVRSVHSTLELIVHCVYSLAKISREQSIKNTK